MSFYTEDLRHSSVNFCHGLGDVNHSRFTTFDDVVGGRGGLENKPVGGIYKL